MTCLQRVQAQLSVERRTASGIGSAHESPATPGWALLFSYDSDVTTSRFEPHREHRGETFRWRLGIRPLDPVEWFIFDEHAANELELKNNCQLISHIRLLAQSTTYQMKLRKLPLRSVII
jgi:hypothetical protein